MSDTNSPQDAGKPTAGKNAGAPEVGKQPKAEMRSRITIGLLAIIAIGITLFVFLGLFSSDGQFLLQLQKTEISRGLITFLVAVVTVLLSLLLVVWVLISNLSGEEFKTRFTSAKEIVSILVGILGTILGFYFGSAGSEKLNELALSELKFNGREVAIYASGGESPYRFSTNTKEINLRGDQVSTDGWLFITIPDAVDNETNITIKVTDAKDKTASMSGVYRTTPQSNPN
jgi:hypothetical protein